MKISPEALTIIKEVTLMRDSEDVVLSILASFEPKFVAEAMIVLAKSNKLNIGDVRSPGR